MAPVKLRPVCYWYSSETSRHLSAHTQDEIFHIPQTQAYCRGEWTIWDPSITTPPGLCVRLWLPCLNLIAPRGAQVALYITAGILASFLATLPGRIVEVSAQC